MGQMDGPFHTSPYKDNKILVNLLLDVIVYIFLMSFCFHDNTFTYFSSKDPFGKLIIGGRVTANHREGYAFLNG